jgi:leader peptidase (prepilin peptidase)/N-methyltransferase
MTIRKRLLAPLVALLLPAWLLAEAGAAPALRHYVWQEDPAYRWQMLFLQAFAYAYAFAFGASLASFLNVVVYRLPRGLNLVHPGSRCPACGTPIEARDNIPVLGWLALGGRCRTCGVRIAPRYLLIELAIGGLFVLLLHLAVFRGGANLPGQAAEVRYGLTILYSSQTWELGRVALYHACLLSLLLACALIQYDRQRVPPRLWGVILFLGLAAGVIWPTLRPLMVNTLDVPSESRRLGMLAGAADGMAGLLLGAVAGALLSLAVEGRARWPQARRSMVLAAASLGVYLGWQGALQIALLAAAMMVLVAIASRWWRWLPRLPPLCILMATAWCYVPTWKWWHEWFLHNAYERAAWPLAATIALLVLAVACRWLRPAA